MKHRKTAQTERSDSSGGDDEVKEIFTRAKASPYRFFAVAAILAALFSLLPTQADAPMEGAPYLAQGGADAQPAPADSGMPAGADVSDTTQADAYLHRTMRYICGHSVQRREELPAQLRGLTHAALEKDIGRAIPGAKVTGFSAREVDIAQAMDIPCPLHWVLRLGENGRLQVLQNMTGETLEVVREAEAERQSLGADTLQELLAGVVFDDVQALEGYMESLNS